MKGKQDYAKRLEEVMTNPDKIDDDVLTDMDFSKGAKRLSKVQDKQTQYNNIIIIIV